MHLLGHVATPEQQECFLKPLASAQVRSCFAMTEPPPGAGADPGQLATMATWDGQGYVVHGRKWLITGALQAGFMILMTQTRRDGQDLGASMFLVPLPHPAVRIVRLLDSMDASFTGGHAEIQIEGLRLTPADVLGEVGKPGSFPFVSGINVAQAIAIAGGFTRRASKTRMTIQRFNQTRGMEETVTEDTPLGPGDILRVPERWF